MSDDQPEEYDASGFVRMLPGRWTMLETDRLERLRKVVDAAKVTLDENRWLCDGDSCTLRILRDAVAEFEMGEAQRLDRIPPRTIMERP